EGTARRRVRRRVLRSPDLLFRHRYPDTKVPLSPGAPVYDVEVLMSLRGLAAGLVALACLTPAVAGAQAAASASQGGGETAADQSRTWIVIGGTTTTLRGDCQEGCHAHGT